MSENHSKLRFTKGYNSPQKAKLLPKTQKGMLDIPRQQSSSSSSSGTRAEVRFIMRNTRKNKSGAVVKPDLEEDDGYGGKV